MRRSPVRAVLAALVISVVSGCAAATSSAASAASAASVASAAASPEERAVAAFQDAFDRHDVDAMLALADTGVTWLSVAGDSVTVETRGAAALRESMTRYFRGTPDVRSTIEVMASAGPWVTVRERVRWTSRAGQARTQAGMAVYEVRDGRIRRVWYYPAVP